MQSANKTNHTEDHATQIFAKVALPFHKAKLLSASVYVVGRRPPPGAHAVAKYVVSQRRELKVRFDINKFVSVGAAMESASSRKMAALLVQHAAVKAELRADKHARSPRCYHS